MILSVAISLLKLFGILCACVSLPGSVELCMLSVAALLPIRRRRSAVIAEAKIWRVAVIIPAHNEEAGIARCVQSLKDSKYSGIDVEVFVIADNCTDQTAAVARSAGITVLERTDAELRGKGYALDFAFSRVLSLGFSCVLVVDADTRVAPDFIAVAAGALRDGAEAVQVRYLVDNEGENLRTRLMSLALRAFNVLRPLGREHLGVSAGIFGNGFGLRSETIKAVPYTAASVVEDLEYHLSLVRAGRRVEFLKETTVYGEMPLKAKAAKSQRSRWEGGRLRMLFERGPGLAADVMRGRLRCLEPLLDLLLLPLAFHILLLLVSVATPVPIVRYLGLAGIGIVVLHLISAIVVSGGSWDDALALLAAPLYVLWKLVLIPSLLRNARRKQDWERTLRNAELQQASSIQEPTTSAKK